MIFSHFKKHLEFFTDDQTLIAYGQASLDCLPQRFSVLVWNIYKGRRENWARQFASIRQRHDLILLQEAVTSSHYKELFTKDSDHEWVMARSFGHRRTAIATGVKTGARARSVENRFSCSQDREPFLHTPKMLLATLYPLAGRTSLLLVVNVHAINFAPHSRFARHVEQIPRLIENHYGPVIVAGDFNTWSRARYDYLLGLMSGAGLKESQFARQAKLSQLNRHLDHVFYRGLDITGVDIPDVFGASDHDPLSIGFEAGSE